MADSTENQTGEETVLQTNIDEESNELSELKKDLEGWKEALIPLNSLLEWEKPYHPGIIVGTTTFLFALIWFVQPSVLTTFSLVGLLISAVDLVIPMVGSKVFSTGDWTVFHEQQYHQICERIMNARDHFVDFKNTMCQLKAEKPKVYFFVVMGILVINAWIGSLVNNLFLTYFLVNLICLLPGLRRHDIVKKNLAVASTIISRLVLGKKKKN
ncbi:ADP-ribosylation factor-like protein 6-interacting protein 1 [Patella vulgata]|uniref:ADP-ribosylation factor-like protein 6-interacting protein 1 n=1 Tax=Patella vulgata TaxID=6465 RepID=UPI0021808B8E|nr:ADP-ribosylation factor-like protein 6-interacting protein 1 [Patella vulgata]